MLKQGASGNFLSSMKLMNADMPKPNYTPSMMSNKFQKDDDHHKQLLLLAS
jgi:hypothetical protein